MSIEKLNLKTGDLVTESHFDIIDNNFQDYKDNKTEILNTLDSHSSQLNEIVNHITDEINIKKFGAIGDGIADDTEALKSALEYVIENGGRLISNPNKIYNINEELIINPINPVKISIDLNKSIIKATSQINGVLKVDMSNEKDYESRMANFSLELKNIILDTNKNTSYGLYLNYCESCSIDNISIRNVENIGIYCYKSAVNVHKFYVTGTDSMTSVGLKVEESGDSRFEHASLNKVHIGIYSKYGTLNMYSDIHGWCSSNFKDSAFIVHEGVTTNKSTESFIMSNIYADSYQYVICTRSKSPMSINNLIVYYNNSLYTDSNLTPYIIYCDNTGGYLASSNDYSEAQKAILMSNSIIYKNPNVTTYYTNAEKKYARDTITNTFGELADVREINSRSLTLLQGSDYTLKSGWGNENKYYYTNGTVTINIAISSQSGFNPGTTYLLGTVTDWDMQSEATIYGFGFASNSKLDIIQVYINGDDGKVYACIPSTVTENKKSIVGSLTYRARISNLNN